MSGETEKDISGWTTDTLHTHLIRQINLLRDQIAEQRRLDEQARAIAFRAQETAMAAALASAKEAVSAALAAQEKAVAVANIANEKRFDSVNEFRGQLTDQARTFMPRAEAEAIIQRSQDRIQDLAAAVAALQPRSEAAIQHARMDEQISDLGTRLTTVESLARGAQANKSAVFAALGVATSLIIAVIVILNFVTSH